MNSKDLAFIQTFVIDHMPIIGMIILVFVRLLSTVVARTRELTITLKLGQQPSS